MRYGQIRQFDVANGPGIRTTFFVTGCTHRCPECFNGEYQDFNYGEVWTDTETELVITYLNSDLVDGLTILGGEPFQNTEELLPIVSAIRQATDKSIWIYSGYTFETLVQEPKQRQLLALCDVLVDGLFIHTLKNLRLRFRGSSNQRILDIQKSLQNDSPEVLPEFQND
ncbi:anaerobic ribonucleoside-triphosphate reductase activating protein [Peptoniphilus equinus]|uniref:Anaerobic ribonucleoside-triphosphate reductase-activating protein n=1 Tax=Peptoniphilus equinus TaxID=3016343 RepID=A0ABY7QVD1_9FIRM|nr:anaerobic ribonucleoside-triphosphate reductase activating protein [Peptoniphilus equinus]WBW50748.1 anaerobic ribonucleoside-triphosphate reductase activating protein [Peptoniphilus equinus]